MREPVACALQVGDSQRYWHEIINKRYGPPPTWTLIALLIQNVPIRVPFPMKASELKSLARHNHLGVDLLYEAIASSTKHTSASHAQ